MKTGPAGLGYRRFEETLPVRLTVRAKTAVRTPEWRLRRSAALEKKKMQAAI